MLLVSFVRLLTSLSRWLEPYYLGWTSLPQSSLALGVTLDVPRSKSELMLENALLRQQLIILQRRSKKPHFTHRDASPLTLFASRLPHWKELLLILKPDTLLRWHRQGFKLFWRLETRTRRGRPPLAPDLVALIQRLAAENPRWSAKRIHGELLKLGLPVAKAAIQTYLRKFGSAFASVAKGSGMAVLRIPERAPRANALCERFLGRVRRACLDHFLIRSEGPLYRVVTEDVGFFNSARPHQGVEQRIPEQLGSKAEVKREGRIIAFPVLHGLHHDYRRVA